MRPIERTFYLGVIAALSLLIFLARACGNPAKCKREHCEEIIRDAKVVVIRDTVEVEKKDSSEWHRPKLMTRPIQAQEWLKEEKGDTMFAVAPEVPEGAKRDSLAYADYYKVRDYSDTNNVEGGKVIVESKVFMNRLAFQRVFTSIKETTISEERTISNTIRERARGQLYAGILAQGQRGDPLTAFGGQFIWKTPKDKAWTISVLYGKGGQVMYQAGHLIKLSFK